MREIGPRPSLPGGRPAAAFDPGCDIGFAAFVQLHQPLYTRYAQARLPEGAATAAVVRATFAHTGRRWRWLLSRPRPAADIWCELRLRVNRRAQTLTSHDPTVEELYEALPADCADSVLLCCHLGLDPQEAAGLMGTERPAVEVALGVARRTLPYTAGTAAQPARP